MTYRTTPLLSWRSLLFPGTPTGDRSTSTHPGITPEALPLSSWEVKNGETQKVSLLCTTIRVVKVGRKGRRGGLRGATRVGGSSLHYTRREETKVENVEGLVGSTIVSRDLPPRTPRLRVLPGLLRSGFVSSCRPRECYNPHGLHNALRVKLNLNSLLFM